MSLLSIEEKEKINTLFKNILIRNLKPDALLWLETKLEVVKAEKDAFNLRMLFAQLPRFTGKQNVQLETTELVALTTMLPGFTLNGWTLERLGRVWVLMQLPSENKDNYLSKVNGLFESAEMNEQVALYAALPFLEYPNDWVSRCEEGIRSNIGLILEAIMYNNPYPAHFLSEGAWNQMVLKAFFTEKDVSHIVGLQARANANLAATLQDYIDERLAARRIVNEEIYKLLV